MSKPVRRLIVISGTVCLLVVSYIWLSRTPLPKPAFYRGVVKSALWDLDSAQHAFHGRTGRYASQLSELSTLELATGVALRIVSVTDSSFTAEGTSSAWPGGRCRYHRVASDTTAEPRCD